MGPEGPAPGHPSHPTKMPSLAHNTRVCKSPGNNGSFHSDRKRPQENPGEGAGSEIAGEDREEGGGRHKRSLGEKDMPLPSAG